MKVKNTTLVITDPCYIKESWSGNAYINKTTIYGDWSCMCYKCDEEEAREKANKWDEYYFGFFHKYNFSGLGEDEKKKAYEEFAKRKKEWIEENCFGEFCADSGRVAVYDYDTLKEKDKEWIKEHPWCACIIPNYTGSFEYVVDKDDNAHIVGDGFYTTQSGL